MRRWTDGKSWSASRVSGSFLTYREMEGKRGSSSFNSPSQVPEKPMLNADMDPADGPDGYRYKPDGLMKQSFSITTSLGQHLHLISYIARTHPTSSVMPQPTTDPALRSIRPEKGMYPESTMHDVTGAPGSQRSPMAGSPFGLSPGSGRAGYGQNYLRHGANPRSALSQMPGSYGWPPSPMDTPPDHYTHQQSPYITSPAVDPHGAPPYAARSSYSTQFDRLPPNIGSRGLPPMNRQSSYHQPPAHQYPPPPEPANAHRYAQQHAAHAHPYAGPPGAAPYPPHAAYKAPSPPSQPVDIRNGTHPIENRLPALVGTNASHPQHSQQLPSINARSFDEPPPAPTAYPPRYPNGNTSSAIPTEQSLRLPQVNGNHPAGPHISPIQAPSDRTPPKNIPSISALINNSPSPRTATMGTAPATTPSTGPNGKLPSPSSIAAIVNGEIPRAQDQPKPMPSMQAPSLHPAEDIAGRDKGLLRAMDRRCLLN